MHFLSFLYCPPLDPNTSILSPQLPVRVNAVVALRSFVDVLEDLEQIRPILTELLSEFFKIMNEVRVITFGFICQTAYAKSTS